MNSRLLAIVVAALLAIVAAAPLPLPTWRATGPVTWSPANTLDVGQFQDTALAVNIAYSLTGGGIRLTYKPPARDTVDDLFYCTTAYALADDPLLPAQAVLAAQQTGNYSSLALQWPDMRCITIHATPSYVCTSLYRYPREPTPCGRDPRKSVAFNMQPHPGSTMTLDMVADPTTADLNLTLTTSYGGWYTLGLVAEVQDRDRGVAAGGEVALVGGRGPLTLKRLDKLGDSFVCEEAERRYAVGYCLAPSWHLCTDLHMRPECRPPANCTNGGTYSAWEHRCMCPNNYVGPTCETKACDCVLGECIPSNGSCLCQPGTVGPTCHPASFPANLNVTGLLLVTLYGDDNHSNATIGGLLTLLPGATLVVHVARLPVADERVTVLRYASLVGTFEATHVGLQNGSQLPECLNYYIYYLNNALELLFFDSCKAANNIIAFAFVLTALLAGILVVVAVVAIVKRRCPRSLDWCLDCRRRWFEFASLPSSVRAEEMRWKGHDQPQLDDVEPVGDLEGVGEGAFAAEGDEGVTKADKTAPIKSIEVSEVNADNGDDLEYEATNMKIDEDEDDDDDDDDDKTDTFDDDNGMTTVTYPSGAQVQAPSSTITGLRNRAGKR